MAAIRLKQDHEGKKKGDVISVPFTVGKSMVAEGVGEYANAPTPAPAIQAPAAPTMQATPPAAPATAEAKATEKKAKKN